MDDPVVLRPVNEDDLTELVRFDVEPDALGEHEWIGFRDTRRLRKRFEDNGLLEAERGILAVARAADDALLGMVTWGRTSHGLGGSHGWAIGIALFPEHRGSGAGTKAQRLLADYLFAHTPAQRLEAGTDLENTAEQVALEKAGFTREGVLRSAVFREGDWRDVVIYGRLRTDE